MEKKEINLFNFLFLCNIDIYNKIQKLIFFDFTTQFKKSGNHVLMCDLFWDSKL